ncbi:MAG: type II toxin-antitoxin system RelE/ParE family toxin [Spirochaetaceae bacterium]|jgi:putative addiction module killer protein|nr:type II toxin-antitoxin system RelE/ParE family toxin [Spirochaetaceae bacterium]
MPYVQEMNVRRTGTFKKWLKKLKDTTGKGLILARIDRLEEGYPGDWVSVGNGLFEMRIHYGPGYRIYCKNDGQETVILLCGGDKSTQQTDIEKAKKMALEPLKEE